jgi:ubiquinone/menaquinone biosynthesis C-methylase UbiE
MSYLKNLYDDTMRRSYAYAVGQVVSSYENGKVLDCGCNNGSMFQRLSKEKPLGVGQYHGCDWNQEIIEKGNRKGLI